MSGAVITVNGRSVAAAVEPRTHLADFLRETLLLTGTHLGCEHGVCGACTVLLDGAPVRGCITYAALCGGHDVRTIEGLADDPVITALRAAFTARHALQCGYCTPGMLITARDIVLRLPDADDDRIRLELAGNLCRCTGYNGIVRAIRQVLDTRPALALPVVSPRLAPSSFPAAVPAEQAILPPPPGGAGLTQTLRIAQPADTVWAAIQDPALVAGCVPGAMITSASPERVTGVLQATMGPIRARFTGEADVRFDASGRSGRIAGQGRDAASNTRLSVDARFTVAADGPATVIRLDMTYALQGPLAQFSRGPVVRVFAAELAAAVAANLEARLRGEAAPPPAPLAGLGFVFRAIWHSFRRLFDRHTGAG